jgi:hypothetical protein
MASRKSRFGRWFSRLAALAGMKLGRDETLDVL